MDKYILKIDDKIALLEKNGIQGRLHGSVG